MYVNEHSNQHSDLLLRWISQHGYLKENVCICDKYQNLIHYNACAGPEWGTKGQDPPPPENLQKIGFLSNSDLDPQKNYEATEPAFNVGQSSARQRNAILMAFRWRADGGPLILVFRSSHHSSTRNKKVVKISDPRMQCTIIWIDAFNVQLCDYIALKIRSDS